ncbi:MAG TPA: response regulator [Abditibacteriaceae bacterium]
MAKRILVVDDEPETVAVLRAILEYAGYEVSAAHNGVEALASVAAGHPDLILLDQMMPEMDGSEALRRLKSNEETKQIPVVILSAKDKPADLMKGWESGTDLYLIKPITGPELTDYIKCILAD